MNKTRFKILTLSLKNRGRVFFCPQGWFFGVQKLAFAISLNKNRTSKLVHSYKEESIA